MSSSFPSESSFSISIGLNQPDCNLSQQGSSHIQQQPLCTCGTEKCPSLPSDISVKIQFSSAGEKVVKIGWKKKQNNPKPLW